MSNTTRPTLASTNARIDSVESKLDAILDALAAKAAPSVKVGKSAAGHEVVITRAKAAKTPKASKGKGKKAKTEAPVATVTGIKAVTKATRLEFIAEHAWAKGLSTQAISAALLDGSQVAEGWRVATYRQAKAAGLKTSEFVAQRKAANGEQVVAKAEPKAPAKEVKALTEAQEARIDAPRNAAGHMTAKREWPMREALAESGKFDRHEIDKRVAKAIRKGLI